MKDRVRVPVLYTQPLATVVERINPKFKLHSNSSLPERVPEAPLLYATQQRKFINALQISN